MPAPLRSLLLLPPVPVPATPTSLAAAYRPSLTATVSALKSLPAGTELQIVISCPSFHDHLEEPRQRIYHDAQELLAGVYSLVCLVCAKLGASVESDVPGGIDARVILIDDDISQFSAAEDGPLPSTGDFAAGPIIDISTFALTRRRWNVIFSVDGEEGQRLLATYLRLANRIAPPLNSQFHVVSGGISLVQEEARPACTSPTSSTVHHVVAVGGTFDHLHAGHKLLLTATALVLQPATKSSTKPRRLIVGITGDELLKSKKYAEYLQSWKQRQANVVDFLVSILSFTRPGPEDAIQTDYFDDPVPNGRAVHTKLTASSIVIECVEIQDPFGPTITDEHISALIVSGETRSGGQAVNTKRAEKGWKELEVFEVDVLDALEPDEGPTRTEDFASKISSTAIRKHKAESARASSL